MKIAILTDLHFGAKQDSTVFMKNQQRFFSNEFFPYINDPVNAIEGIACLGDTFDRRKQTNHLSLAFAKAVFFDPLHKSKIPSVFLVGNHDSFYRNTTRINALNLMVNDYPRLHVVSKPETFSGFGNDILMMPWICDENQDESLRLLATSNARMVFGHFELNGFKMYKGSPDMINGMDPHVLNRFPMALSGHYHHASQKDNIRYLGTPYEITWQDYGDSKGFYVLDTQSLEIEKIKNPEHMFRVIVYDDTIENFTTQPEEIAKDQYVKVVVQNKSNPVAFEEYIRCIEKSSPADLQVADKQDNVELEDADNQEVVDVENMEDYLVGLVPQYAAKSTNDDVLSIAQKRLIEWYHASRQANAN